MRSRLSQHARSYDDTHDDANDGHDHDGDGEIMVLMISWTLAMKMAKHMTPKMNLKWADFEKISFVKFCSCQLSYDNVLPILINLL